MGLLLQNSKLSNLQAGLPSQFNENLQYLIFHRTKINITSAFESIKKSGISLSTIQIFCLWDEKLSEIPENFFVNMPNIKVLSFREVEIEKIDEKSLNPLANSLEFIEFYKNNIKFIPQARMSLKKVKAI